MTEGLDIRELSRFANRALSKIERDFTREAKSVTGKIGQRAVKAIKAEMLSSGNADRQSIIDQAQASSSKRLSSATKKALTSGVGISRKSAIYKAIKRTGVWGDYRGGYSVRTYVSSSIKDEKGDNPRRYAWYLEHGTNKMDGKRFTSKAIPKLPEEYEQLVYDAIDKLLAQGVAF